MLKVKFRKDKLLTAFVIFYLIICQSCMKMRMNSTKTHNYFKNSNISYIDSTKTIGNNKIHYLQTGKTNAKTLFFVHGSPGSWDAYKQFLTDSLLLKKFRMIAIDRPGFGYSNFGEAENLDTQAYRLVAFLKSVDNGKPIILVGHSMGGPVITKMASLTPKSYSNLVILAGSIDPNAENPELWRNFLIKKPLRYLIPGALRPSNDELWWLKNDLIKMKKDLEKITSKVTIIHGTKDRLVPYSNMQFIQREFVNANTIDTISIKDADHFIPWTHYDIIRNTLLNIN